MGSSGANKNLEDKKIKAAIKNFPEDQYTCPECGLVPEIVNINFEDFMLTLECKDHGRQNIKIDDYFEKENNSKNSFIEMLNVIMILKYKKIIWKSLSIIVMNVILIYVENVQKIIGIKRKTCIKLKLNIKIVNASIMMNIQNIVKLAKNIYVIKKKMNMKII